MSRSLARCPRLSSAPRMATLGLFVTLLVPAAGPLMAQDSTAFREEGWLVGGSVGFPGFGGQTVPWRYATLGLNAMYVRAGSIGAEIAMGTVPGLLNEGVVTFGVRGGVSLPLAVARGMLLVPSGGLSMMGAFDSEAGGGAYGYHLGGAAVIGTGRWRTRVGVTRHVLGMGTDDPAVWLLEIGMVGMPRG